MRKVPGSCNLGYQVVQPDPNSLSRPKFVKLATLRWLYCCCIVLNTGGSQKLRVDSAGRGSGKSEERDRAGRFGSTKSERESARGDGS